MRGHRQRAEFARSATSTLFADRALRNVAGVTPAGCWPQTERLAFAPSELVGVPFIRQQQFHRAGQSRGRSSETVAPLCRAFLYGFPPHLGHGHLNATGSEVSGRSIGNWLCQSHPQRN
jgi:hypothetical protein